MACLFLVVDDEGKVILANDKIFGRRKRQVSDLPTTDLAGLKFPTSTVHWLCCSLI